MSVGPVSGLAARKIYQADEWSLHFFDLEDFRWKNWGKSGGKTEERCDIPGGKTFYQDCNEGLGGERPFCINRTLHRTRAHNRCLLFLSLLLLMRVELLTLEDLAGPRRTIRHAHGCRAMRLRLLRVQ